MKANLRDLKMEAWLRIRDRGLLIWTTKKGKEIPIKDMDDKHLINTILMLERAEDSDISESDILENSDILDKDYCG